jgi:hypothetical protein
VFPSSFAREHVEAPHAEWDEYSDGSGLAYKVFTAGPAYGSEKPGDLSRIVYGPSTEELVRFRNQP